MKKIFTLLVGIVFAATSIHAEQFNDAPRDEISISYGLLPVTDVIDAFADILGTAATLGYVSVDNWKSTGSVNLDYSHHFAPWFALGVNASYSELSCDLKSNGTVDGSSTKSYYTIMPSMKFDWFRREHISMYSRVAVGVTFENQKEIYKSHNQEKTETDNMWMGQVSPFGIEVGSNNFRGFTEVGFGQAGCIQLGFRVRL